MFIRLDRRLPQQKPGPGAEIDWGHPLGSTMLACWVLNEGAGVRIRNLVNGEVGRLSVGNWRSGQPYFGSQGQYITLPTTVLLPLNYTITTSLRPDVVGTYNAIWDYQDTANGAWTGLWNYPDSAIWYSRLTTGGPNQTFGMSPSPMPAGVRVSLSCVVSEAGTVRRVYKNGRLLVGPFTSTNVSGLMDKVNTLGNASYAQVGSWDYHYIHARALSPDEVRWLSAEPYAMLRPPGPARRYYTVSALDQVFRLASRPQRFRLTEKPQRFRLTPKPQRFRLRPLPQRFRLREAPSRYRLTEHRPC